MSFRVLWSSQSFTVICTLHVLRHKIIVSAAIKRSFYITFCFWSLCSRVFAKWSRQSSLIFVRSVSLEYQSQNGFRFIVKILFLKVSKGFWRFFFCLLSWYFAHWHNSPILWVVAEFERLCLKTPKLNHFLRCVLCTYFSPITCLWVQFNPKENPGQ